GKASEQYDQNRNRDLNDGLLVNGNPSAQEKPGERGNHDGSDDEKEEWIENAVADQKQHQQYCVRGIGDGVFGGNFGRLEEVLAKGEFHINIVTEGRQTVEIVLDGTTRVPKDGSSQCLGCG